VFVSPKKGERSRVYVCVNVFVCVVCVWLVSVGKYVCVCVRMKKHIPYECFLVLRLCLVSCNNKC